VTGLDGNANNQALAKGHPEVVSDFVEKKKAQPKHDPKVRDATVRQRRRTVLFFLTFCRVTAAQA
jgi:hypothetical protein